MVSQQFLFLILCDFPPAPDDPINHPRAANQSALPYHADVDLASQFIIAASITHLVLSDGYPKESPEKPFITGSSAGSGSPQNSQISGSSDGTGVSGWTGGPGYYGSTISTDYVSRYYGPIAKPVVLRDGTIAYTPEVAAARAAHLAVLEKAKALWYGSGASGYGAGSGHGGSNSGSGGRSNSQAGDAAPSTANTPYSGPLAMNVVLPSGYLADTPDIAAARAAHLNALLKARADAAAWKAKASKGWQ
ncbi:hypothetical protein J6590_000937 [Homalodisca vitripennis]|nr:hypothetical protein J6590_000937 [Homalodisca vitripennis]